MFWTGGKTVFERHNRVAARTKISALFAMRGYFRKRNSGWKGAIGEVGFSSGVF